MLARQISLDTQLINHFSNDNSYLGPRSDHTDNARSVTRNLRNLATAAPIRSKFMYCNMMFTVATYLVEQKSGMSFADFIEERFFKPLGMESSNLQPERARAKGLGDRLTPGHWWDPAAKKYATFKTPDAPEAQGAGSIVTSVTDYLKYVKAMMNKEAPFTEEIYNGLIKGRIIIEPSYEHLNPFCAAPLYAAGWEVHYYRGHQIIVHDGCISGSSTSHFFVPDLNFAGAIFGNADSASYIAEIILYELLDELLEIPKSQRVSWPKVLYEKWSEGKEYEDRDPDDPAVDAEMRRKEEEEELEKLCPGLKDLEPQTMPLEAYTGSYYHVGWKGLTVEIKDGQLFIDCTDRSYVFNLTLKHVCEQTKYLVDMREVSQGPGYTLRAEFRFENDRAVKLGIVWDGDLDEFIWFHRVDGGEAKGLAVRAKGDDA